jgi:7,8-dihydropterin-6-yl-methyl-4-(beta-D-ribofuranosyl)aminobenzene 5'-phosphate synthase
MKNSLRLTWGIAAVTAAAAVAMAAPEPPNAKTRPVKVTVLSTMLADMQGIGEWGFAALVEVDGYRLLLDTGAREETVLRNALELKVDLAGVTDVVLSHHHADHTGGLVTLRRALSARNPRALSRAHVAPGMFLPRRAAPTGDTERNLMPGFRNAYEATGAAIVEHARPQALAPGVWVSGPIARRHPERNYPRSLRIVTAEGLVEDDVPEDQSVVVDTGEGLLVITGCGHAGIANILAQAREIGSGAPVRAVVGGLHLLDADETSLAWTAARMKEAGVRHLMGAHCTGLEAVYRLRALLGVERSAAVVGAVGSSWSSSAGLDPLWLAH